MTINSIVIGQGLKEKVKKRVINELEGQCLGKNGYVISVRTLFMGLTYSLTFLKANLNDIHHFLTDKKGVRPTKLKYVANLFAPLLHNLIRAV